MNKDQTLLTVKIAAAAVLVGATVVALTSDKVKSAIAAQRNADAPLFEETPENVTVTVYENTDQ